MATLLWERKPRFAVALVVRGLLIVTSHTNCDVTICPVVMRCYADADADEQWYKTSKTQVSLAFCKFLIVVEYKLTTYTVCAAVVGTAIRHSIRCAGRRGRKRPRNGRHNSCCAGLQYQQLQRRPYRGQFLYSTTICKLVDLIPALHQSDCRIPNWVSAKTVLSSSTNHGQTTARFRSFFR